MEDLGKDVSPGYPSVDGNERLSQLLDVVVSGEGECKQAAEQEIRKLEAADDHPVHLTEVLLNPNWREDVRIFASKKLSEFVEAHWCVTDEKFLPPEIDSKNKTKIRELLLAGLSDTAIGVRQAVAKLIDTIVRWDWPDNWPGLIDVLVSYLNGEGNCLHGALLVLDRFSVEKIDDQTLDSVSIILREVNSIFAGENYSEQIRGLACRVLCRMVSELARKKGPVIIPRYVRPTVPLFCTTSMRTWTSENCSIQLKIDILEALTMWMESIPKYISDFLAEMTPLVWEALIEGAKDYRRHVVNGGVKPTATGNYSDDLVQALCKFLEILMNDEDKYLLCIPDCRLSDDEWFYLQDCFSTPHALRHLIMLMEVSDRQINRWKSDVDDFVQISETFSYVYNRSGRAGENLIRYIERKDRTAANNLIVVIMKYLQEENERRIDGESGVVASPNNWKSHEAYLYVFSLMRNLIVSKRNGTSRRYKVVPLLQNIVLADLNNTASHPLLVGRCLILGGIYSGDMPANLASAFLKAIVNGLEGSRPMFLKICAVCAISLWYERNKSGSIKHENMLKSRVPDLFEGLFDLAKKFKSAGVHKLVLKGIETMMPFDGDFTASMVKRIYSLTIKALLKYRVMDVTNQYENIFKELTLNPSGIRFLQNHLKGTLLNMLSPEQSKKPRNGMAALEIVGVIVTNSPLPLNQLLIRTVFPMVCDYIISVHDCWRVNFGGINLISKYLSVALEEVIYYQDNNGRYGAQFILQVIIHSLKYESYWYHFRKSHAILILLIHRAWYEIRENVNELLKTLLHCMMCEKFKSSTAELLTVYAHLIHKRCDAVFKYFANALSPLEQKSALECIISKGFCKRYQSAVGEDRETMRLALGQVLEHGVTNPASPLHQITFTESLEQPIPILVKICQLTINNQPLVEQATNEQ